MQNSIRVIIFSDPVVLLDDGGFYVKAADTDGVYHDIAGPLDSDDLTPALKFICHALADGWAYLDSIRSLVTQYGSEVSERCQKII